MGIQRRGFGEFMGLGKEVLLGEENRVGFETEFYVKSGNEWKGFRAEALGEKGEVLRGSRLVASQPYISQYVPGRDNFLGVDNDQVVLDVHEAGKAWDELR